MMFERHDWRTRLAHPGTALAAGMVVSIVLLLLPESWTAAGKSSMRSMLRPGQIAAQALRESAGDLLCAARRHFDTAAQLADTQRELKDLRQENRRLQGALAAARGDAQTRAIGDSVDHERLLGVECVEARILGQEALAFLGRKHLLEVGWEQAVAPNDFAVEAAWEQIDCGSGSQLTPGQLVVRENRVWGKIFEVGRYTSTVRSLIESGYRDLVRLADGDSADPSGPQGILEGTGEPLARIRHVEVTEPVTVGDAVYTAAGKGILSKPLLYGHVVRVERPVGAAHWDIWMRPAVDIPRLERVAVLKTVFNPERMATKQERADRRG